MVFPVVMYGCESWTVEKAKCRRIDPFDLSQTFLVGGGLLVPCSLPRPPIVEQLTQMVTIVPGQDGWFQSVCFP